MKSIRGPVEEEATEKTAVKGNQCLIKLQSSQSGTSPGSTEDLHWSISQL